MRSPKGVVTRSPVEWNMANMFWGWYESSGPGPLQILGAILYNNTTASTFVVWHAAVSSVSTNITATNFVGTQILQRMGAGVPNHQADPPQTNIFPMAVQGQAGLGIIYSYAPTSVPTAYINNYSQLGQMTGTQWSAQWEWGHEWPMAVIPPNWGYALQVDGSTNELSTNSNFTFWFEVVAQPYP